MRSVARPCQWDDEAPMIDAARCSITNQTACRRQLTANGYARPINKRVGDARPMGLQASYLPVDFQRRLLPLCAHAPDVTRDGYGVAVDERRRNTGRIV